MSVFDKGNTVSMIQIPNSARPKARQKKAPPAKISTGKSVYGKRLRLRTKEQLGTDPTDGNLLFPPSGGSRAEKHGQES